MKTPITLFTIGLLSASLLGCASPRLYDDTKIAMIHKDSTTDAELLEWFGPATTRAMEPDGNKILTWKFDSAKGDGHGSSGRLEVHFNAEGKVISYNASSTK